MGAYVGESGVPRDRARTSGLFGCTNVVRWTPSLTVNTRGGTQASGSCNERTSQGSAIAIDHRLRHGIYIFHFLPLSPATVGH